MPRSVLAVPLALAAMLALAAPLAVAEPVLETYVERATLSDTSRTPLFTVLALLIGFSAVSVAFWGWFRFRHGPPMEKEAGA